MNPSQRSNTTPGLPSEADSQSWNWPLVTAWLATITTIVLALLPSVIQLRAGYETLYSPTIALTAVTVMAVIWYTYFTQQTLEHARRTSKNSIDRQRRSLCTAVLSELRDLAPRLKNVHTQGPSAGTSEFFSHPMVKLAAANPALVNATTIQALAELSRRLSDVQEFLRRHAELDTSTKPSSLPLAGVQTAQRERAEIAQYVKFRAAWAFNSMVRLVSLLTAEGGKLPAPRTEGPVERLDQIELLADPFEQP